MFTQIAGFVGCVVITFNGAPIERCEYKATFLDEPTVVVVEGYDWDPVEVNPPTRLDWWVEDPQVSTEEFTQQCDDRGGKVTDLVGDVWVCQDIDY